MMLALPFLTALSVVAISVLAQTDTLGLQDGFLSLDTPSFSVELVKDSQTLYSLRPKSGSGAGTFDFIPSDVMSHRAANRNYHLGDITFRARPVGSTTWISGDTSTARKKVSASTISGSLAAANLAATLPSNSPLNITRRWVLQDNNLELLFDVKNALSSPVEIGSLGAPLEFNNIFTGRTAAQTNELCSLFDPYIGLDAGYVQVAPLLGTLPPLVVLPASNTSSPLEGWRFLPESTSTALGYQSQTFEGLFEWQFHTLAYAQNEWAAVTPWNAPTSATLQPGATRTYGLQFRLAPSIRGIEDALPTAAVGVPGYVLPMDQTGKLFLRAPAKVASLAVEPAGALSWAANVDATNASWVGFDITSHTWGRARLTVTYADGRMQTVHYYVTKGATEAIADLGSFLTTEQWFDDPTDPFRRSPAVISYDREVNAVVHDDPRAWIPGLSDEAGAGSWLAAAMKQYVQPNAAEVAKMEMFVNQTLHGSIQNTNNNTVKKAVYFYQPALVPKYDYPSSIDWGNWWSWNEAASFATDRAYDYVHVAAAYWALYRVARNYPALTTTHDWTWYLERAVDTVAAMTNPTNGVGYVDDGLMDETVILVLLDDLKREGLTANATLVQSRMQTRAKNWAGERYPFGSEMAWDSTGQEGVYAWATYFNDTTTALNVINSILAYQPTVAHWGYNGNARRYWDNIYGGKLMRVERQIHHYGSGLNALPLMAEFMANPTDMYLLRVAFGGASGPLSSIDEGGFAAASFHSWEDTLKWDGYSGDYGPNFVGLALNQGTYIVQHAQFGWQAFGGNVLSRSPTVRVQVRDAVRRRVFVAAVGALLELDAGAFEEVEFDPVAKSVKVTIAPAVSGAAPAPAGRLVVKQTAEVGGVGMLAPAEDMQVDAGAFVVPFANGQGVVTLVPS